MVRMDVLRDALKSICNAQRVGKKQVVLRPSSKVVVRFLHLMQQNGYIGDFAIVDNHCSDKIVVNLIGRLNKAGVISPRFDVQLADLEKWVVNLLPSRLFGHIILSTSQGIMDHVEAQHRQIGGKIIGYFY
ncbi:Ribosomal protein S15A [Giardia muris]|uniref:Ribosomal protein S15A n=1 Tax=Giardia muris TaxID=5742 RepID=A0A4Z1SYJ5_GIAMU|nr:Ribosomal protein S15A [Giardia muris]|eukprot:TNJ30550.1 Ribosomal protein S15A [Giardia muris]